MRRAREAGLDMTSFAAAVGLVAAVPVALYASAFVVALALQVVSAGVDAAESLWRRLGPRRA